MGVGGGALAPALSLGAVGEKSAVPGGESVSVLEPEEASSSQESGAAEERGFLRVREGGEPPGGC